MKGELFTHEVSQTSTVFGRKKDVRVVFQGDQAATDGTNIILPSIDLNGDVTDGQADIIRGYVDHEAGHVRHSDMPAIQTLYRECEAQGNTLLRAVHNALEDVWLERRVRDEYPGAERNLVATATAVNDEFLREVPAGDPRLQDDKFVSAVALTWEGRKNYEGDTTCQRCLDLLDDGLRTALGRWVDALDGCQNTRDVIALAREVERQLNTGEHRDTPKQPQSGDGQGSDGQGNAQNGSDTGDATGDGTQQGGSPVGPSDGDASRDGSDAPRNRNNGDDGTEEGGRAGGGVGDGSPDQAPDVYENFGFDQAVNRATDEGGLLNAGGSSYRALSTAHDKWHHRTDQPRKYGRMTMGRIMANGNAQDYNNTLEATAGLTNIMRRKLERALMAKQQRDWDYGREHGRLDSRRLASAYAAKPNVFKMRDDRLEMDTALSMLIDLSGSMNGHKVHLAMQAVIAMCEAIDRTGIQYEVLGFNNRSGWIDSVPRPQRTEGRMYSRFDPLDMYVFKDFQERLNEAKGALSTITHMSGGDNGDSEAVQHAFDRLRKRGEKRKVLMVFSDGRPRTSGDFGFRHLQDHLRSVVADIEAADVDVMGIGICDTAVSQFYPKFVVVDSVEDLAGSALDIMARTLMGERFVVDNSKLYASA